jgi:hypothetical protein
VKRYEDGRLDISLIGVNVVKVLDFFPKHPAKLYPCAEIESLDFDKANNPRLNHEIIKLLSELYQNMKIDNIKLKDKNDFMTSDVAHKVGYTIEQELEFMLLESENKRAKYMLSHLLKFVPQVIIMEKLRKRAELNGHFQHIKPPF